MERDGNQAVDGLALLMPDEKIFRAEFAEATSPVHLVEHLTDSALKVRGRVAFLTYVQIKTAETGR
jgi:hypothetical protein